MKTRLIPTLILLAVLVAACAPGTSQPPAAQPVVVEPTATPPANVLAFRDTGGVGANTLNLSYFAALDADETRPSKVLSGDRNLEGGTAGTKKDFTTEDSVINATTGVRWDGNIHQKQGNVGLSDGSVGQNATDSLRRTFRAAGMDADVGTWQTIRLLMPVDP